MNQVVEISINFVKICEKSVKDIESVWVFQNIWILCIFSVHVFERL